MELTASGFVLLLLASVVSYYPLQLDHSVHPRDQADCLFCDGIIYDFIIVGAGSAGCVVANRLTENPNWNVLLIEAGGDENFVTDVPLFYQQLSQTRFNWNYTTINQPKACLSTGGVCDYPRGKGMGGSSTTNAMMYVRGNRADFDEWERAGNPGWGYKSVLPYFLKSENVTAPELQGSPFRSNEGPLSVGYARYKSRFRDDLINAGKDYGLAERDYNGINQNGIGVTQLTVDGPNRCSTSKAFLNPIKNRKNLYIFKNSHATRVLINRSTKKAIGVEFVHKGRRRRAFAVKEIILSAGAINTPQLLMLSGVGPRRHLEQNNISVIADLPVGKNLQDHNLLGIQFLVNEQVNIINSTFLNSSAILEYAKNKSGILTTNGIDALAFFNLKKSDSLPPEIQFHLTTLTPNRDNLPIVVIGLTLLDPKSKGFVRLNSPDPFDKPLIHPNYYGRKSDFKRTVAGVKEAINFMSTDALKRYDPKLVTRTVPTCAPLINVSLDTYLDCYIQYHTRTIYHPIGTAKMGPKSDKSAVVDPELQVYGISHLRVIDASIMPKITRGNTNAPVIMIGEKGADLIKKKYTSSILSLLLSWAR
ncbi:glucose dehydrogenase [FAD, quinone] [Halyomorpha halys]|uniref:glucose dehydrogenase [FAD, quinone] n=1 Tax=Halyomorpha halys TaxID=286706 RepID=UPI0006D5220A|nr:glucose dehydrogenase [FAD, quinone]-like [Halyomorpha halys]